MRACVELHSKARQLPVRGYAGRGAQFCLLSAVILGLAACADKDPKQLLQSALQAARIGQWEEASHLAGECLDASPDSTKARILKGICLQELGQEEKAQKMLKQTAHVAEDLFAAQYFYGWVLCEQGEYGQALAPLERAHNIKPAHLETLVLLSRCALEQNLPDKGRRYLQPLRRFEAFRENPALYNSLGLLSWKKQNYEEAGRYFQQALQFDKENPAVLQNIAVYWDRLGNFRKALHYYRLCKTASQRAGDLERAAKVTERLRKMLTERNEVGRD